MHVNNFVRIKKSTEIIFDRKLNRDCTDSDRYTCKGMRYFLIEHINPI
jgi:hypothetical protein